MPLLAILAHQNNSTAPPQGFQGPKPVHLEFPTTAQGVASGQLLLGGGADGVAVAPAVALYLLDGAATGQASAVADTAALLAGRAAPLTATATASLETRLTGSTEPLLVRAGAVGWHPITSTATETRRHDHDGELLVLLALHMEER